MKSKIELLVQVMDQLRSPGGCPWDAEQTHQSLAKYLLEETYEALEAIENGDLDDLREELGDLLLQIVFHARIAQETDSSFTLDAIAKGLVDKLVRRHPHVFDDIEINSAAELETNWTNIKAAEKPRESVTDGVAIAMPALQLATQLFYRARENSIKPVSPEILSEVENLLGPISQDRIAQILFGIIELARKSDIDPETVLRAEAMRFRKAIRTSEGLAP